jgi:hypothetical protein
LKGSSRQGNSRPFRTRQARRRPSFRIFGRSCVCRDPPVVNIGGADRWPGSCLIRGDRPDCRESASPHDRVTKDRLDVRPSRSVCPGAVAIAGRSHFLRGSDPILLERTHSGRRVEANFDGSKPIFAWTKLPIAPRWADRAAIADRSQFSPARSQFGLGANPLVDGRLEANLGARTNPFVGRRLDLRLWQDGVDLPLWPLSGPTVGSGARLDRGPLLHVRLPCSYPPISGAGLGFLIEPGSRLPGNLDANA